MSVPFARTLRNLAPYDLRLVWRDSFLLFIALCLPVAGLVCRWLIPYVTEIVSEWVELERYYGLIVAFYLVAQQPILLGAVVGILFVEERDEGTLTALQTTPLSLRGFLAYRLVATMGLSVALTTIAVSLTGLVSVSPLEMLAVSALASLGVPVVALVYAVYVGNKVQAVTAIKPLQSWAALPALLYFAPGPWPWIGSLAAPLYYPMRLFWTAADGRAEWWLVLPGAMLHGAAILWLLRRFGRAVYA